jgi:hypothetical protein
VRAERLLAPLGGRRTQGVTTEGYSGRSINVESYRRRPAKFAQWMREAG